MLSIVLELSHLLSSTMSPISSYDSGAPLPSDLSKLNVSQLKAICKERRIVGYSKLAKAALIRKLGELGPSSQSPSFVQNTRTQTQTSPLLSEFGSSSSRIDGSLVSAAAAQPMGMPSQVFSPREPNTVPGTHIPQSSATSASGSIPPSSLSRDRGQNVDPSVSESALNVPASKRKSPEISLEISQGHTSVQARPLAKKRKVAAVSSPLSVRADIPSPTSVHVLGDRGGVPDLSLSALPANGSGSALVPGIKEARQLDARPRTISMSGKRFKPLKVTRPLPATLGDRNGSRCLQGIKSVLSVTVQPSPLWHLDFPVLPEPPLLSAITIPPSLSQRKLVHHWAIILSGLSDKERLQCCLVSKLIRYAGERWVPSCRLHTHTHHQSIHRPIISSQETSLGDVYHWCCSSPTHHL
jgi:hypothetical protein